jgi:hypothetical protein
MKSQNLYAEDRCTITIEVSRKVIEDFRVAVSKKHRGRTKGMTYIEYNNALSDYTKTMTNEFITSTKKAPVFGDKSKDEESE